MSGARTFQLIDDEVLLDVTPVILCDMPTFVIPEGFTATPPDDFISELPDTRLMCLNGVCMSDYYASDGDCDYCRCELVGAVYYNCKECNKRMCELCFSEKTEGSAGSRNYLSRKESLDACFAHSESLHPCSTIVRCVVCCAASTVKMGLYYRYTGIDGVCEDCHTSPTESCRVCANACSTVFCEACLAKCTEVIASPREDTYGSMLGWIPILRDDEMNVMFINLEKDSPNLFKVSLGTYDDHGRMGIYTLKEDLTSVLCELTDIQRKYVEKFPADESSWKKHYSSPICRYLRLRNLKVHFG